MTLEEKLSKYQLKKRGFEFVGLYAKETKIYRKDGEIYLFEKANNRQYTLHPAFKYKLSPPHEPLK